MYYVIPISAKEHDLDRCEAKLEDFAAAMAKAKELKDATGTNFRIVSVSSVWVTQTLDEIDWEDRRQARLDAHENRLDKEGYSC